MKIRTAVESDLQEIVRAENACFPKNEAASERDVRERLRVYPDHFWLMYEEERLVSFVNGLATDRPDLTDEMYKNAYLHNEGGAWQMIFGVGTVPDQRGKGRAGELLRFVISEAEKQGRSGLVLTCKERLIPFYTRFGFLNEGLSKSEHGGEVWYQMRLRF